MKICLLTPDAEPLAQALSALTGQEIVAEYEAGSHVVLASAQQFKHLSAVLTSTSLVVVIDFEANLWPIINSPLIKGVVSKNQQNFNPASWANLFLWTHDLSPKNYLLSLEASCDRVLNYSSDKARMLQETELLVNQKKISTKAKHLILSAVDELLMNAFFDAPVDELGHVLFKNADRAEILTSPKPIYLEVFFQENFVAVCVTDNFGSVNEQSLKKHLLKAQVNLYSNPQSGTGGGIGLASLWQRGVSLGFKQEEKKFTQALAVIPLIENSKIFHQQNKFIFFKL